MNLRLHDTLTRRIVPLVPANADGVFRFYECGMTPSGEPHIGHARTAIVFDTLKRWMRFRGLTVMHVRNVTDVEDKIINKAKEGNTTPDAIVAKFDAVRKELFGRLNLNSPDVEPYATKHIKEIVDIIGKLVKNELAYPAKGDVFFRVRKFAGYGKLSKNSVDELVAGVRVERDGAAEDPLDFALWKAEKPGEPAWDSPWGRGRPGWHIECSAMAMKYLGETFDLHGGGHDLIFPHHENEIAQSEGATGKPFARIWAHPGWVTLNKEKMSKSIGNVLPMRDVLDRLKPAALRLLVGQTHWRTPFEWSDDAERQAKETLGSLTRQLELAKTSAVASSAPLPVEQEAFRRLAAFDEAMDDDLSTPRALAEIFPLATKFAQAKADGMLNTDAGVAALTRVRTAIVDRLAALGIEVATEAEVVPSDIQTLVDARKAARTAKDWKRSDELRNELKAKGWLVEDSASGQTARRA